MGAIGLALIALVGVVLVLTGLPAYAVLIFAAVLGATAAVLSGSIPFVLLGTLPGRLINLLESDLLQALPLYVLMGVLLNRMSVAPAVFRTLLWLLAQPPGRSGGGRPGTGCAARSHERMRVPAVMARDLSDAPSVHPSRSYK